MSCAVALVEASRNNGAIKIAFVNFQLPPRVTRQNESGELRAKVIRVENSVRLAMGGQKKKPSPRPLFHTERGNSRQALIV